MGQSQFEESERFVPLFHKWFQGDRDAIDYARIMVEVAHFWDDLVDEEKCPDADRVNAVMRLLTFDLPRNPFFVAHSFDLTGAQLDVFLAWRDATCIENGEPTDDDLAKCYQLRAGLYGLFARVAWIVGGDDWSATIGPEIRRSYGEMFEEYCSEMRGED